MPECPGCRAAHARISELEANVPELEGKLRDLLDKLKPPAPPRPAASLTDKGYDSDDICADLKEQEIQPVIPTKANRVKQIPHDKKLYQRRNCVERLAGKLKQFRAIATRYDKLGCTFLAAVHLVAAFVMAR